MLAARRSFRIGEETIRTPLMIPSYSSRAGGHDVCRILKVTKEFVSGPILVSAYDIIRHGVTQSQTRFASHVFLDSGGYEAGADADLSEVDSYPSQGSKWTVGEYQQVLKKWDFRQPTALVTYDSPDRREQLEKQIARAKRQRSQFGSAACVFLIKPEPASRKRLNVNKIVEFAPKLAEFDVIGVTEKELGDSLVERLQNVSKIRRALLSHGLSTPIHVFGSLDPVACPLFFICGADIFDGLTWIRYAYHNAMAIYRQNMASRTADWPPDIKDGELTALIHVQNYHTLGRIKDQMIQFIPECDFDVFVEHSSYFKRVWQRIASEESI